MIKRAWIALPTICLLAILTRAQEQPSGEIATLPTGRGVYYQSPSGWMSLPFTIIIPSINAGGWTLWPSTTVAEIKSPSPEVRISAVKPTLYLRGISPAVGIYFVQEIAVHDFRKLRLNLRRDEQEWTHFIDTVPFDLEQLDGGVARIRPCANLPLRYTPLLPASKRAHAQSFSALSSRLPTLNLERISAAFSYHVSPIITGMAWVDTP